jgi:hypothetical protein
MTWSPSFKRDDWYENLLRGAFVLGAALWLSSCGTGSGSEAGLCQAAEQGVSTDLPDNTAVLQAALNACAGQTMHVAAGTYIFAPALAYADTNGFGNGITIPDRTSIIGDGRGKTILQIKGPGNYVSFFWIHDAGNVSISQLTLAGNNARNPPPPAGAPACYYDYGHAVFIQSTTRPIQDISIVGNEFISFTGTSWISVLGGESGNGVGVDGGTVTINDNYFKSVEGNAVAPQYIVCPASAVAIQGLGPAVSAAGVSVSGNVIEADYIKSGVAVWSGAARITIAYNTITRAGMGLPVPHGYSNGSYAILVYQQHAVPPDATVFVRPTAIDIVDNVIDSPYSSGIYVLEGRNVRIEGNLISGQIDTYDATEPRGAIALNILDNAYDGVETAVSDNIMSGSAVGISIAGGTLPIVDSNVIESIPSDGIGMKVNGTALPGVTLTLTNTLIAADDGAANVSSLVGFFPMPGLTIDGLYQTGAAYPLRWYSDVVGTPAQPQKAYCSLSAFGSIRQVFIGDHDCGFSAACWTPQTGFWPDYTEGCSSGGA